MLRRWQQLAAPDHHGRWQVGVGRLASPWGLESSQHASHVVPPSRVRYAMCKTGLTDERQPYVLDNNRCQFVSSTATTDEQVAKHAMLFQYRL